MDVLVHHEPERHYAVFCPIRRTRSRRGAVSRTFFYERFQQDLRSKPGLQTGQSTKTHSAPGGL